MLLPLYMRHGKPPPNPPRSSPLFFRSPTSAAESPAPRPAAMDPPAPLAAPPAERRGPFARRASRSEDAEGVRRGGTELERHKLLELKLSSGPKVPKARRKTAASYFTLLLNAHSSLANWTHWFFHDILPSPVTSSYPLQRRPPSFESKTCWSNSAAAPLRVEPEAAPRPRAPRAPGALRGAGAGDPALGEVAHRGGGVDVEAAHAAAVHLEGGRR